MTKQVQLAVAAGLLAIIGVVLAVSLGQVEHHALAENPHPASASIRDVDVVQSQVDRIENKLDTVQSSITDNSEEILGALRELQHGR